MSRHYLALLSALILMLPVSSLLAQEQMGLSGLKKEIDQLRSEYEQRINELEMRLQQAEQEVVKARELQKSAESTTNSAVAVSPPPATPRTSSANSFNPAISLVLNSKFREMKEDARESIPGFAIGEEAGGGDEGFSLGETELNLSANIDDKFFGSVTVALVEEESETAVELEEAYIQTLALPAGFGVKAGRFFSSIGYLNQFHSHTDDFEDRPLPYRAFLNNQFLDDGVQLSWVAPTNLFIELGTELLRGNRFPAGNSNGEGFDNWSLFVHIGGDVGASYSWRAGLSYLSSDAAERETGEEGDFAAFTGDSDLWVTDFVWKWAPNGNARYQNFKLQGEYFWRDEDGFYEINDDALNYKAGQKGWYLQGIYQFMPRWRTGLRYAGLSADNPGNAFADTVLDDRGHNPYQVSWMLDWSPSEFSRLRLQYNLDKSLNDRDDQILLQYIMSFGSHGAHVY